jgi:hypothetical protein
MQIDKMTQEEFDAECILAWEAYEDFDTVEKLGNYIDGNYIDGYLGQG